MTRRAFVQALGGGLAGGIHAAAAAETLRGGVLYPVREAAPTRPFSWYEAVLKRIPPLKHPRGGRWPLIAWEGFSFEPQPPEYHRELLRRGFAQHIRLDPAMIDAALAIQGAGSPVIAMEGMGGAFPASLAGEPAEWAHQLDPGYSPKDYVRPCPSLHSGWARFADQLRETLRRFRGRGVRIDAVWADWEGDPLYGEDRLEQARRCRRCRELLPPKVMASQEVFTDYAARTFYELFGAYYAAPVLEFYPRCSVTDWLAQPSAPEARQPGWNGDPGRVYLPPLVTAWNPSAYGAASWLWKSRPARDRRDQAGVDGAYTRLLLSQVSLTGRLGAGWGPEKEMIPWVARWVTEAPETEFPVMSRERYREVLRHLWLRGVAGMQVFAPRLAGFEDMAMPELEDAAAVYGEMLAYREFLEAGEVLSRDVPDGRGDRAFWSGLRLGDRAVVRVFHPGPGRRKHVVSAGHGRRVELTAEGGGVTFLLEKGGRAWRRVAPDR